ncbi:MAG: N-acetylglutamate synthase, partial [Cellulomonadaceae bacterium]|nr:N-acetylglutamate synthase [Cellulomonadaceae bacterium]
MTSDPAAAPPHQPYTVRPALPRDVNEIRDLVAPYADERILLAKELVGYYEAVQEFV